MLDIVVCEIAGLQRHSNPVHGRALFCAKSSWCRDASSGRRHEGTTVKRCHFNLPDFLEPGSDRAKCKARRAGTGNASTLAEYRKAPCNYLNDKEAGQGPRFASITPFVSLAKCRTCARTRRRSLGSQSSSLRTARDVISVFLACGAFRSVPLCPSLRSAAAIGGVLALASWQAA